MAHTRDRGGRAQRRSRDRGASAVEFAIILPVLCAFLYGIIEFGMLFMVQHGLTEAAADAARAAATVSPQTNAQSTAETQVQGAVNKDVGNLVGASCSTDPSARTTAALWCYATPPFQCPGQPSGYQCITVTIQYNYGKDPNPIIPSLLPFTPSVSASSTVLLSGSLTS